MSRTNQEPTDELERVIILELTCRPEVIAPVISGTIQALTQNLGVKDVRIISNKCAPTTPPKGITKEKDTPMQNTNCTCPTCGQTHVKANMNN
jgi:hypothetical protein